MSHSVTLKDVASLAGVSYQTVSKVIHQSIQVRDGTTERVWQAIDTLGYVPNESARNLRLTQVSTIGYTWQTGTQSPANPILETFLQGMMSAASEREHQIFCFPTSGQWAEDLLVYEKLYMSKKVGGFILSHIETDDVRIPFLIEHRIPFVCFGNPQDDTIDYIEVDGGIGMRMVVDHLVERGHRKIALLAWEGESRVGADRYRGYQAGMAENGLSISKDLIRYGTGSVESGHAQTKWLLGNDPPTAIAAMNDLMAIGAINAAIECDYKPGERIAICGFDDFPLVNYLRPSLTSVRQPAFLVGELAVRFLIEKISLKSKGQQKKVLLPDLVIRESSSKYFSL